MKNIEGFLQNTDLCIEAGQDHWIIRMKKSIFSKQKRTLLDTDYTRNDP